MPKTIVRIILALQGAAALFICANILMDPVTVAAQIGVSPLGDLGLATIRADLGSLFGCAGLFMLAAALLGTRRFLILPISIAGFALLTRAISITVLGFHPELVQPMIVEAVTLTITLAAYGVLVEQ